MFEFSDPKLSSNKMEIARSDGFLRGRNDSDSFLCFQLCINVLLLNISQTFFNVETFISQKFWQQKLLQV
jgi:hypothetical protein